MTGDEAGTIRLDVAMPDAVHGPIPVGRVDLADSPVVATVHVGQNLFADHCDDVKDETPPTITDEWPVVAGWFEMPDVDPDQGQPATITLRDAVVDTDDGEVALDAIEIAAGCYGCHPG